MSDNTQDKTGTLLVTAEEASNRISVSVRHFLKLVSEQRAPQPVRLGRNVRWRVTDLKNWAADGCPAEARKATVAAT